MSQMSKTYAKPLQAVLLAAGQGKRMKSSKPKVLHEVLGKPILGRILAVIDQLQAEHVHVVIGHGSEQVLEYLKANPPRTPWSTHLQEPQLGTGHALMQVVPSLDGFNGSLLVSVADCPLLKASTLAGLVQAHQKDNAAFSLLTTIVPDSKSYGRIVRDKQGRVTAIVEDKDATDEQKAIKEINPAIYCLDWPQTQEGLTSLRNDNKQKEYYLTDLLAWSCSKNMKVADAPSDWREVGGINSRIDLSECNLHMRDETNRSLALDSGVTIVDPNTTWIAPEASIGSDTTILPGCYITGEVQIAEGCTIGPNTQITGPSKIGARSLVMHSVITKSNVADDCRVGPFAHLRDGADVANHCRIGNFVEVKKSSIGEQTNVSHLSYIGDASLGRQVNIGAGTITANYDRLSGRKSKTIIGDNASTGSNSVLVAPVVVGDNSMVAAGTVVTKDVPEGSLAVARTPQEHKLGWVEKRKRRNDTMEMSAHDLI